MGSDRARVTYDRSRQWRAVVAQQGRVSLEADFNEEVAIGAARDQLTTLDAVGPSASPDGGYQLAAVPAIGTPAGLTPADLTLTAGTLYLGGERLELPAPLLYTQQPDWLDRSTDPRYVPPLSGATTAATGTGSPTSLTVGALGAPLVAGTAFQIAGDTNRPAIVFTTTAAAAAGDTTLQVSAAPAITTTIAPGALLPAGNELVYLVAAEQEVSAVEDPALADVALGGPDTTQRLRMLQRVLRTQTPATTCTDAWNALQSGAFPGQGYVFNPATMRLTSAAGLQVSFPNEPAAPNPCQPVTTGGYLGAENQLIRVAIAGVSEGQATLVWGFDDASFLYRLSAASFDSGTGETTVTLASAPPDSAHYPAAGQVVELLRDAAALTATDFVASSAGVPAAVAAGGGYDPTTRTLALSVQAPTDYLESTPQLYLRVWQGTVQATLGVPVALGDTGVAVTLTSADGVIHAGDFWRFALRPLDPTIVYPARYLQAAQPPDGPRTWACPLGMLSWSEGVPTATSCLPTFDNLAKLTENVGGCCTVSIRPADVDNGATLAAFIAGYAGHGPVTICLEPGTYTLPAPLVLGTDQDGLTLRGCRSGVVLRGADPPAEQLLLGLVVIQDAANITLDGLEIQAPLVPFTPAAGAFSGLAPANATLLDAFGSGLDVAIGVSVQGATELTISDCTFEFASLGTGNVFGAGVYASGVVEGVAVTGSRFLVDDAPATVPFADLANPALEGESPQPPYQLTFGYLHVPTGELAPTPTPTPALLLAQAVLAGQRFGALPGPGPVPFPITHFPITPIPITHPPFTFVPPPFTLTPPPFTIVPPPFTIVPPPFTIIPPTPTPLPTPTPTPTPTPPPLITEPGSLPVPILHDATIEGCRFEGLSLAILGLAQLGTITIDRNTVRNCYGGIWLVSFEDGGAITLFDQLGSGASGVWQDFSRAETTALLDRVFMMAFALGQVLPTSPPVTVAIAIEHIPLPLRVIAEPSPFQINRVQTLLGQLAGTLQAGAATPASATPPPAGAAEEAAAFRLPTRELPIDFGPTPAPAPFRLPPGFIPVRPVIPPLFPGLQLLTQNLTAQQAAGTPAVTAPPAETGVEIELRLQISDCEVDAVVADSWSGAALVVLDTTPEPGAMILSGNRLRNRFPQGQAAVAVQVAQASVTGNLIANEVSGAIATGPASSGVTPVTSSLVLQPTVFESTAAVAVTGNVLVGQDSPLMLPARPLAAPLNVWDALNAVTAFTPPPTPTPTPTPSPTPPASATPPTPTPPPASPTPPPATPIN